MQYDRDQLDRVFSSTHGRCHLCGKTLYRANYALQGERGAWEVEHSVPRSMGGTDTLRNLKPACIACNREKGVISTRAIRARSGRSRAPMSAAKRSEKRTENAIAGGLLGAAGFLVNPAAGIIGVVVGAALGHSTDPEED